MTTRDEVLAAADAVVLCASHRFGAPPTLDTVALGRLRPEAFLINVARADLVDTASVVEAIRAGALRGYAVDDVVLDPDVDGDLLTEGRVLQTGHSAWWRDEVLERGRRMWARHLLAVLDGAPIDAVTWPVQAGRCAPPAHHRSDLEVLLDLDDDLEDLGDLDLDDDDDGVLVAP